MISKSNIKSICRHRELVENYDKAVSDDTQMWDLHHRLETHFSDGSERPKYAFLSKAELIALDMYWNRPPEELIFLSKSDHYSLHGKNEQFRRNISLGKGGTGSTKPNKVARKLNRYWDKYINECLKLFEHKHKGHKISENHKLKISNSNSKPLLCKELNIVFKNSKEASLYLNNGILNASLAANIREVCRGLRKTAHGFTWSFVEGNK